MKLFCCLLAFSCLLSDSAFGQTTRTVENLNNSGVGSLRQAVADSAEGDTIDFAGSLSGETITLTSGHIQVSVPLTIDASALPGGISISGNQMSRVFVVGDGPTVFDSLTIKDGRTANGTTGASGSNGVSGGGIVQNGGQLLTLRRCVVEGCRTGDGGDATDDAEFPGHGGSGGAIYTAFCELVLDRTTIRANRTGDSGSHLGNNRDSKGGEGGGIYAYRSDVTLIDSTIADNFTGSSNTGGGGGDGGGIWIFSQADLTITRSTLSGNFTGNGGDGNGVMGAGSIAPGNGGHGGGIYMSQLNGALIENSTIANNFCGNGGNRVGGFPGFPGSGGGAYFRVTALEVINSTVVGNFSGEGVGTDFTGGLYVREGGELTIANSVVAGNRSESQPTTAPEIFRSISGSVFTDGGNFLGNNGTVETEFPLPMSPGAANENGDYVGASDAPINPLLGSLANNGGPTKTMKPAPPSPLIDSATGATGSVYPTDQRGKSRIYNGKQDIGSVEYRPDYGPLRSFLQKKIRKTKKSIRKARRVGKKRKVARLKKKLRRFKRRLRAVPAVT